jgi:hypothetical protein
MPAFKSDESFLEKISMGATGTQAVLSHLTTIGHRPIELERFSTSFKIWKSIKIKRIRVPDILCLRCAIRVESRAKAAFEVSMSHSLSDSERAWDYGLSDSDYVAIIVCVKDGTRPIDWKAVEPIQYISVKNMRHAFKAKLVEVQKPKGAEEGFEVRVVWPSSQASADGRVLTTSGRLKYMRASDQRSISLALNRKAIPLLPLVSIGDNVVAGQAVAGVIPVITGFACSGAANAATYMKLAESSFVADRYAATKALAHFAGDKTSRTLLAKVHDEKEHIYVRLEAAAGLARQNTGEGWAFIDSSLTVDFLQHQLEAVIILAEIGGFEALRRLSSMLGDESRHAEIRAGAAWALGEIRLIEALSALIDAFESTEHLLRIEAARALARLAERYSDDVVDALPAASETQRAGVSWALTKSATFNPSRLLSVVQDDDARRWAAYIIGSQPPEVISAKIETLKDTDPEVYFAVTVLWKIITSWIHNLETF